MSSGLSDVPADNDVLSGTQESTGQMSAAAPQGNIITDAAANLAIDRMSSVPGNAAMGIGALTAAGAASLPGVNTGMHLTHCL
jgi:hypothetical protein